MQKWIGKLLLLALFFNTLHALVLTKIDPCLHETTIHYIQEIEQGSECGGVCEIHHLFHFIAIETSQPLLKTPLSHHHKPNAHLPSRIEYQDAPSPKPPQNRL